MDQQEKIETLLALLVLVPSHHPTAPYAISPAFDKVWEKRMKEDLLQELDYAHENDFGTIGAILQVILDSIKEYNTTNNKTIENIDLLCDLAVTLLGLTPNLAC